MKIRRPVVAGQFYSADRSSCLEEMTDCFQARPLPESLPDNIAAGLVPHAGWVFSGSLAALVFSAVRRQHRDVATFVVFGAAHGYLGSKPVLDDNDFWETPLGKVAVDRGLAQPLLDHNLVVRDSAPHRTEHSIEVQVPFIQHLFPEAAILPVIVPPHDQAVALGEAVADAINVSAKKVVCIGSTDLTHYGPRYGFAPMGIGDAGLNWATKVNDRRFIDLALRLDAHRLLAGAAENGNACGPGAAAAAIAAAKKIGKAHGILLAYTSSNEVMLRKMGSVSQDSVGYAAIVF